MLILKHSEALIIRSILIMKQQSNTNAKITYLLIFDLRILLFLVIMVCQRSFLHFQRSKDQPIEHQ